MNFEFDLFTIVVQMYINSDWYSSCMRIGWCLEVLGPLNTTICLLCWGCI